MAKFVVLGVLLAFTCAGSALLQHGDIANAAAKGDWNGVHELIKKYVDSRMSAEFPLVLPSPQFLKPSSQAAELFKKLPLTSGSSMPEGRYYARSEYSYAHKSNINGRVEEDKGGLGMINDNGRVTYYKPNPPSDIPPIGFNKQANGFGMSPYGG